MADRGGPQRVPPLEARLELVLQALDEAQRGVNEVITEIRAEQTEGDAGDQRETPRRSPDLGRPDPGVGNAG